MIRSQKIDIQTKGENDIVNISNQIQNIFSQSGAKDGLILLFSQSTTSALTIIEYEEGLLVDMPKTWNRLVSKSFEYQHEKAHNDGNGHSHIRSSIIGVDLTILFSAGHLLLGKWQQIVLMEFDVRPRKRSIRIQIISE